MYSLYFGTMIAGMDVALPSGLRGYVVGCRVGLEAKVLFVGRSPDGGGVGRTVADLCFVVGLDFEEYGSEWTRPSWNGFVESH